MKTIDYKMHYGTDGTVYRQTMALSVSNSPIDDLILYLN